MNPRVEARLPHAEELDSNRLAPRVPRGARALLDDPSHRSVEEVRALRVGSNHRVAQELPHDPSRRAREARQEEERAEEQREEQMVDLTWEGRLKGGEGPSTEEGHHQLEEVRRRQEGVSTLERRQQKAQVSGQMGQPLLGVESISYHSLVHVAEERQLQRP